MTNYHKRVITYDEKTQNFKIECPELSLTVFADTEMSAILSMREEVVIAAKKAKESPSTFAAPAGDVGAMVTLEMLERARQAKLGGGYEARWDSHAQELYGTGPNYEDLRRAFGPPYITATEILERRRGTPKFKKKHPSDY